MASVPMNDVAQTVVDAPAPVADPAAAVVAASSAAAAAPVPAAAAANATVAAPVAPSANGTTAAAADSTARAPETATKEASAASGNGNATSAGEGGGGSSGGGGGGSSEWSGPPLPVSAEQAAKLHTALQPLMDSNSLIELLEGLETLIVYTRNLILYPDEKKYRKIKISNVHYVERLGHLSGAEAAMGCIGYLPQGEYLRLDETRLHTTDNDNILKAVDIIAMNKLNTLKNQWAVLPERTEPSHAYRCVYAVGSHSAIGKRHNMEDDEIMVDAFCGVDSQGFFGLYDGHGGRATVDFVVKALHINLEQYLRSHPACDVSAGFRHSYMVTDGQLRRQSILRSGSTSVTCVIREVNGKRVLSTANVGDSRAVLGRAGQALRLTIDHKASLPEEAKRIHAAGGFIGRNKRVNGVLAISRALGDHMLKNCGGGLNDVVSAEPYCSDTELTDEDTYVLLACDGVWDVMTDQEAMDFIEKTAKMYEQQIQEAKRKGKDTAATDSSDAATAAADTDNASSESAAASSADPPSDGSAAAAAAASAAAPSTSIAAAPAAASSSDSISAPLPALTQAEYNEVLHLTSKALVREALDRRSLDNVTVLIIQLNPPKEGSNAAAQADGEATADAKPESAAAAAAAVDPAADVAAVAGNDS